MKELFFSLAALVFLGWGTIVFAAPDIGLGSDGMTKNVANKGGYETAGVTDTTLSETVGKIIKWTLSLVGTIFMALTIYAGFLWMTASGNDEQVTKATGILKMAMIGLVITLASYGITVYVMRAVIDASSNTVQVGGS